MGKEELLKGGLYKELPTSDLGVTTLFRNFSTALVVFQYREDKFLGKVRIRKDHLQMMIDSPEIKVGDGKSPQTLRGEEHE